MYCNREDTILYKLEMPVEYDDRVTAKIAEAYCEPVNGPNRADEIVLKR